MAKIFVVIFSLVVVGCISQPPASVVSRRGDVIEMAKREISRRHIRLPSDCNITVVPGVTAFEGQVQRTREEYLVHFTFTHGGKRDVVYEVVIDERSRTIEGFVDYRETIQGGR